MILGAQLYTLRNSCKTLEGLDETLKQVADIGFKAVQLSGVCEYESEWIVEKNKEYGIKAVITHIDYDKIVNDTDAVIEKHKKMGCPYVGLGSTPGWLVDEAFDKFFKELPPAAEKLAANGLKFMYHNHDMEFAKSPESGKLLLDELCDRIPEDIMGITLDTYWVQAGGGDPAWWIQKLGRRAHCVHFKDMICHISKDAEGKLSRDKRIAPIGEGNMNYDSIIEACLKADVEYGMVELDFCYDKDPLECMKRSYKFLHERYGLS